MLTVDLAVNTGQGVLSGFLDGIGIELGKGQTFKLEPRLIKADCHGPKIKFTDKKGSVGIGSTGCFTIYNSCFEYSDISRHIGNAVWNRYSMSRTDVLRLLKTLKHSEEWCREGKSTIWWNWWDELSEKTRELPSSD